LLTLATAKSCNAAEKPIGIMTATECFDDRSVTFWATVLSPDGYQKTKV
ncbi:MAG: hypothetical protein ACI974_001163, partial [Paraglaciecola sp.]